MAATRESNPLADIVAVTTGPAFVMVMVGSLVFFLIEVLYGGNYPGRLLYTMFFYVFGCVLIARIAIQFGRMRANLYALGLGAACLFALMTYVDLPPGIMRLLSPFVNIGLMAIIWWASDRLTWDCTHLDADRKSSGRGILAAAGLDETVRADGKAVDADLEEPDPNAKPKTYPPGFVGWMERVRDVRAAQKKKPHTPGVTILYFALAALPLFALGQSLIAPGDTERRRATFLYMALYVGSALALLVTTSLFGLKKYLEERNARVPAVMTFGWLGLGIGLIVVFLGVGAVLPRPHSETPWFGMQRAGSKDRDASKYAVVKDGDAGKGDGAQGRKTEAGDGQANAKNGKEGGNAGEKGDGGGKGDDGSGGKKSGGEKNGSKGESGTKARSQGNDTNTKKSDPQTQQSGEQNSSSNTSEQSNDAERGDSGGRSESTLSQGMDRLSQALGMVGTFIKWLVWVVIALAVLAGIVLFFLKWLAPFTQWAQNLLDWLRSLFARKLATKSTATDEAVTEAEPTRPPSFSSFVNPFRSGTAEDDDPADVVRYTFEALDAWAWDREMGRTPGETPLEFATRIGHHFAALDEPAYRAATLFVQVQYSRGSLPKDTLPALEALWDQMDASPARRVKRGAVVIDD